jgi:hypothetical protein
VPGFSVFLARISEPHDDKQIRQSTPVARRL